MNVGPSHAELLLNWFDRHRRILPWRTPFGEPRRPYHVWLSEVMLQQTRVETVVPRFETFIKRWPSVEALAAASREEVLDAWAGMGYYRRAFHLHETARIIAGERNGRFPTTVAGLRALPGIGEYTAAAIASIAFGLPVAAVDGNVFRVMARLSGREGTLASGRESLREMAQDRMPRDRAGEYAEAVMELGAMVCRPRNPRCDVCPWHGICGARIRGCVHDIPAPQVRPRPRVFHGVAFRLVREDGRALVRRQQERGPFRGMLLLPATSWSPRPPTGEAIEEARPFGDGWRSVPGEVEHVLTHRRFRIALQEGRPGRMDPPSGSWVDRTDEGLPALTRKLLIHGSPGR